ncbi:MAG: hypothetical protein ACI8RD_006149 [Bacillariaceae sp.]|jgi:hypothetical protein
MYADSISFDQGTRSNEVEKTKIDKTPSFAMRESVDSTKNQKKQQ